MFTITRLENPPPESIKNQIMQMVIDYVTDIGMVGILPSNPLYPLYQYGVGFEVNRYQEAMDGSLGLAVELIVALDGEDPTQVIGFLLYLPYEDDPQACAVAYMAVRAGWRRHGVARGMLAAMLQRYPHAELACFASKVPCFEVLGFQVLGARGPQVLMNTRDHASNGRLAVLDVEPIYRSEEVRQIHAYLLNRHGRRAMVDAEKSRDRHMDRLARQADALVVDRLGDGVLNPERRPLRLV
ncbi:GNAT family N-acetyltransferase [uncultured Pseudomonas sp.]|uniref:GNAT family N-acetyltransferase n=1 Tax=uncultured Pseudomonas sp. TaxID=114707 RepID=UPI0025F0776D|nr:GNAT family N-acetyltransferase [uncultured Pseudomonas sp.]